MLTKVTNKIFFNIIIRSLLISFLPVAIMSGIGRQLNLQGEGKPPNYPTITFQLCLIGLSIVCARYTDPVELYAPTTIAKYGSFYETMKFHRLYSMLFNSFFMIRRIMFVVVMLNSICNSMQRCHSSCDVKHQS